MLYNLRIFVMVFRCWKSRFAKGCGNCDKANGCLRMKAEWKVEIKEQLQKIKSDGACYPQQLEEELIRRRRQELRFDPTSLVHV